jgi:predicted phage-related endonuclease
VTAERLELQDPGDRRQEFLEEQQRGIGATDAPKILGLSKWGSALTVYERLTEGPRDDVPSLPAWLGMRLQGVVAELYTTATGQEVRAANQHFQHREDPFLVAHLDYRAKGRPSLLVECKTRAHMTGYGEDGTGEIPAEVWTQVQHEMLVTGATETHVAVLFGHHTFRVYPIPRDEEFIASWRARATAFWNDHVLARVPPEPTGHYADDQYLRRLHPSDDGTLLAATAEQVDLMRQLVLATNNVKATEAARDEVQNQLKLAIGDAAGLIGPFGEVTWKRSKDSESVAWDQVAITYAGTYESLVAFLRERGADLETFDTSGSTSWRAYDPEALQSELRIGAAVYETAVGLATSVRPGSRRFLAKLKEA